MIFKQDRSIRFYSLLFHFEISLQYNTRITRRTCLSNESPDLDRIIPETFARISFHDFLFSVSHSESRLIY